MRILFIWTGLTSYMGDCWRALAARSDVELKVVIVQEPHAARQVSFSAADVLRGLEATVLEDAAGVPDERWREWEAWGPDALFVVGWHARICRAVVERPTWRNEPKICCFDMPWRWRLRCLVAPLALGRFLRRYDAAFVPGSVCARYARWLGFRRVFEGLFSIDTKRFSAASSPARDYFLYVGRNSPEKRLDVLREGYRLYREAGGTRELRLYGKGLEQGFVAPEEMPRLMKGAAAFVLASDFDPWPLVLLEAMSAGCPVIASDRCTNRPELGVGWTVFRHGDARALARALSAYDASSARRQAQADVRLVAKYDCEAWSERVRAITREVSSASG